MINAHFNIPMKNFTIFLVLLSFSFSKTKGEQILNLGGQWNLKCADESLEDITATVPGGIYTDLMKNDIIPDIFYGDNYNTTRWIPRQNWIYYRTFNVEDSSLLESQNINIVFEGLDTFSTVLINDVEVGKSENMFVRYIFDVTKVLEYGTNTIEVRFESPINVSAKIAEEQDAIYHIPPDCYSDDYGECHANMIRKMQASFSWDWGPAFPSVGIWKDVHIEAYESSLIRYVVADVQETSDKNYWKLYIKAYLANNTEARVRGTVDIALNLPNSPKKQTREIDITPNEYGEFVDTSVITISKSVPDMWWPNGFGNQSLYNLTLTFSNQDSKEESSVTQKIGFRQIDLVQDKTEKGLTFYFKVNDVPIFMKGSNEIPINILPELGQDKATIKRLLTDARDSHMNMLRVWGGGVYESDYFYELADEYGILIWQDFMFACAMYPADEKYERNVLEEVRHQVKRLKSHTSIALFSGNNENEGALRDSWYGTEDNFEQYKKDYISLYIDTIGAEYNRITENRSIFVSSSPSNGLETISEGYVADKPGNSLYGDIHFYDYARDSFDPKTFPIPRFASEYGYQSLPSMDALLTATNVSDLELFKQRQHHPDGAFQMEDLMSKQIDVPEETDVQAYIYYSQIIQAMSIKIETEHYRSRRSYLDEQNQGYTMGALYWQLNDVWVAPTWSGIDFTGKWKMLQYFAREFFAPVIITAELEPENKQLQIYAVCDTVSPNLENMELIINYYNYESLVPVSNLSVPITKLEGLSSDIIVIIPYFDDVLTAANCSVDRCFVYFKVMANNAETDIPPNYFFPNKLKDSAIPTPNLSIESVSDIGDGRKFEIVIKTDKVALFVWLDVKGVNGRFSENGFVQVSETKTIYFKTDNKLSENDIRSKLSITVY